MPRLGKGTECVLLLLSQVSKDMRQSLVSMLFPILGVHVSGAEFLCIPTKVGRKQAEYWQRTSHPKASRRLPEA